MNFSSTISFPRFLAVLILLVTVASTVAPSQAETQPGPADLSPFDPESNAEEFGDEFVIPEPPEIIQDPEAPILPVDGDGVEAAVPELPPITDPAVLEENGWIDPTPQPPRTRSSACFPAGGARIAPPNLPGGDFVFVGGGWGHGAGMSQYGAQGAARLGCSVHQILTTYFPGTQITPRPNQPVVVGLAQGARSVHVTAKGAPVTWEVCHYQTGACQDVFTQPVDATWTVNVNSDGSYTVPNVWSGGSYEHNLRAKLSNNDGENRQLSISATGDTYRWGVFQVDSLSNGVAYLTLHIPDLERYLFGLAEVPANWPASSLQAQAIAGRSYAHRKISAGLRTACRCHLYNTTRDQNYEGYSYESADANAGGHWRNAVGATAGQVLTYNGAIAETLYSSSHGGHSESGRFTFGGQTAYLQPVDDSRWDLASSNPYRRWAKGVSASELGALAGVGVATSVSFPEPLGAMHRVGEPSRGYGGMIVNGTQGSTRLSGNQVRRGLGLKSTLFWPSSVDPQPVPPPDLLRRVGGANRILTSVEASKEAWTHSDHVVIASATNFPDAVAGARLAAGLHAPLLLTEFADLSDGVRGELQRIGAKKAWILGGTSVVSLRVEGQLSGMGLQTQRLAGDTRYATAAVIATTATSHSAEVILVTGHGWADAMAASSISVIPGGPPVLFVRPDGVPAETRAAMQTLGVTQAVVIGGEGVIPTAVTNEVSAMGVNVRRIAGPSRYDTAAILAGETISRRGGGVVPTIVVTGNNFPDALSAGSYAAQKGALILLSPDNSITSFPGIDGIFRHHGPRIGNGWVFGGPSAVSYSTESEFEWLMANSR